MMQVNTQEEEITLSASQTAVTTVEVLKPPPLIIDHIDEKDLSDLRQRFLKSEEGCMGKKEFRELLLTYNEKLKYTEEEYNLLFLKIVSGEVGDVTWDVFISYLQQEYTEKKTANAGNTLLLLAVPISGRPKFVRGRHRHPIIRIAFYPAITQTRIPSFTNGKYITVSHDGVINSWSLNMKLENSWTSTCPQLKVATTWITDMVCLPDISKICTSSTERELRFYDTTIGSFELWLVIYAFEQPVMCMYYNFNQNIAEKSILLCGDMGGSLKVFQFSSANGGPFKQNMEEDFGLIRYSEVVAGNMDGLVVKEFVNQHKDWVGQVYYYKSLEYLVSCSNSPTQSLLLTDLTAANRPPVVFNVKKGITSFSVDESRNLIATGSSNHEVQLWSAFNTIRPIITYAGHQTSIVSVLLDPVEDRIYSLSRDRVIRVWENRNKECIEVYSEKLNDLGPPMPMVTLFNPHRRTWMIGCLNLAILKIGNVVDPNYFDGYTHSRAVTKTIYNAMLKCLVSVGMDSCIMNWQPLTGKRTFIVQNAHTRHVHGKTEAVGITTACFNPTQLYLLTGAIDGTVKMWNFNAGICLRNMSIEKNCCVTDLIWIPERILAVGWNRHVTEWEDSIQVGQCKSWETYHVNDILASTLCHPTAVATTSYAGELVFCRIETGQSYKRFNVANPNVNAIAHDLAKGSSNVKESIPQPSKNFPALPRRRVSSLNIPVSGFKADPRSGIHAVLYLKARTCTPKTGTLLVSLEKGVVQLWTHHSVGGLVEQFYAVHTVADYVISMSSDSKNEYLFTGHVAGYVKVWLIRGYGMDGWIDEKPCMPLLRLKFPFLLNDRFPGRAKRAARGQDRPMLLSSFRAHVNAVNHIEYIEINEIIVTSGNDCTVRLWTLGGQYIGTLGGTVKWPRLPISGPIKIKKCRVPPDIKKVASSTTLKVLTNAYAPEKEMERETKANATFRKMLEQRTIVHKTYGRPLPETILGNHYSMPRLQAKAVDDPVIDRSNIPNLRILNHMQDEDIIDITPPSTPEFLSDEAYRAKLEGFLDSDSLDMQQLEDEELDEGSD